MNLNKLLVARRIVSIHAWKGRTIRLKSTQCKLTYAILLQISYGNHSLRFQFYWITTSAQKKYVFPLQSVTIEHPLKQGKLNVFGKIILNLLKLHKYILTNTTYLMVTDYEAIQSSQCNVITRFGVPNGLVFYITYFDLTEYLLWIIQKTIIKLHKDRYDTFYITHWADRVTYKTPLGTFLYLLVYGKRAIPSLDIFLWSLLLTQYVCSKSSDSFQSLQGGLENLHVNALVMKW